MRMLLLALGINLFPLMATAAPPQAPTALVIISCRVDDVSHLKRYPMAPHNFRDLEWHLSKDLQLECRRDVMPLEDLAVIQGAPPIAHDFGKQEQCARAAMFFAADWDQKHKGWATLAVGCPVPLMNDAGTPDDTSDDFIVGWKMPECPSYMPGTENRMKCVYDESLI